MTSTTRANRAYPSIPQITGEVESHTFALLAMKESLEIHERRTGETLDSFVRLRELIDLDFLEIKGSQIVRSRSSVADISWSDLVDVPSTFTPSPHTHSAANIITGLFADGLIAESNVTQHQSALAIDWSQLSSVPAFATVATSGDHGDLSGLGDDDHTQYLLTDGSRDLTGSQNTQALLPVTANTYDIGAKANKYRLVAAETLFAAQGNGTFTQTNNALILGHASQSGAGTAGITATSTTTSSAFAAGAVSATDGSGLIESTGNGSFAQGVIVANTGHACSISSTSFGSFAQGYVISFGGGSANTFRIRATVTGAFAQGSCGGGGLFNNEIFSGGAGSFAQGAALTFFTSGNASIISTGRGSFAQGFARSGTIAATVDGAFSQGFAEPSFSITASGLGALAHGYAGLANITASAAGSLAVGSATAAITASAVNAMQFGPGVNAVASSLRVGGAGLHLKMTAGAFGTPANGQVWVNSGYVNVRSNAANVQLGPVNSWTVGAHGTLRDFTGTTTAAEALQLIETLVEDLRVANII